ncbi:hypothetical protein [Amycolatopsis sp. NBC_01480]|uniref:hypothetical protein n=1 Tax=Amycolatopsis sp. NBC_01480 TaxID=2903562 RepID=UPI002E2870B6|nr:hypothetical protein [Amycolatopsis sp. NBC_01480]
MTTHPPPGVGPASTVPPYRAARSRIPASPFSRFRRVGGVRRAVTAPAVPDADAPLPVVGGDQDVGPGAGTGVVERVRERFLDDAVGHQLHALVEGVQFAAGSVDDLRAGRAGSSPPRPGAGRAGWSAPVRRSATSPSSPEATALPSRSAGSAAVRVRFGEGECPHHCHQVRVRHRQLNATLVIGRVEQGLAAQVQQIENDEPVVDVGLERLGAADRAAELVA